MHIAVLMGFLSFANIATASPTIECGALQQKSSGSTETVKLSSSSASGYLTFTGSTSEFIYSISFEEKNLKNYQAIIKKLPMHKIQLSTSGALTPRNPSDPRLHTDLRFFDLDAGTVWLDCGQP